MSEIKPFSQVEIDIVQSYADEIVIYRNQIKDLKATIERLSSKLKQCKDCEYSATKWTLATIKDIAENIINGNLGSIYGLKKIIDRCNEVLADE